MAPGPVLLLVDDDPFGREAVEQELQERYALHYRVRAVASEDEALAEVERLADLGEELALVLVGQGQVWPDGGVLLDRVRRLHPQAKRCLLMPWGGWGDAATGEAIFDLIARGRIDHYLLRPGLAPDELFHHTISALLLDWAEAQRRYPFSIMVVGADWSGRAHELREVLGRCAIPHSFVLAESDAGREVVSTLERPRQLPVVVMPDGTVLQDPSNADLARAAGWPVEPSEMDLDLVIIGAGPAGLSAAVYAASEGLSTLVVDEGGVGGQSASSSLIRNYLGFPRGVSGRRLAQQAYEQAWVLGAKFLFMQTVEDLAREPDGRLSMSLPDFGRVSARTVLVATGASYRRLGVPQLEELVGWGVHYGGPVPEAPVVAGEDVYVVGGANSAGQAALLLCRYARRVTLVVRGATLEAGMSHYLVREIESTTNIHVRCGTEVVDGGKDVEGWLDHLVLRDRATGAKEEIAADALFAMIGASPRTGWLPPEVLRDDRGFVLTGADVGGAVSWPLSRSRLLLETSMPGVLAAGDVRHGSAGRVASAVGEGSVAVQLLHRLFEENGWRPRARGGRDVAPVHR